MQLRRILVPLDHSAYSDGATQAACFLAKAHDASLTGETVLDSPEIRSSIIPAVGPYYPLMLEAVQAKLDHAERILEQTLASFSKACEEAGVHHLESCYEGMPAQKLLESSIFHDLVVIGLKTSFHFETRERDPDTLDKLLSRTATPVLAVPPEGLQRLERAVVAFDGSPGASRALRDFMVAARPFDPSVVLVSAELPDGKTAFLLGQARALVEAHGFSKVETLGSDSPVEEVFSGTLLDEADLVVAGIHSKQFLKDIFVGSFATRLIRSGRTPLFLSH